MEKTMENYIIEKLESVEKEKKEIERELRSIKQKLAYFETRFEVKEKDDGTMTIEIKDQNNDFITFVYNEQAKKLVELMNYVGICIRNNYDD